MLTLSSGQIRKAAELASLAVRLEVSLLTPLESETAKVLRLSYRQEADDCREALHAMGIELSDRYGVS